MERNINLLIEHQCPQCGGPAILDETDRLFACQFCEVKSFIMEQGHFRYMLPAKSEETESLVYFPYWRFKGMIFSVSPTGVKDRFVDISHQAIGLRRLPPSLGLRTQALKLKFVAPEGNGTYLKPVLSARKVMEILNHRFQENFPKPSLHMADIGENMSLIFAPFYAKKGKVFDGVLDQPLFALAPDDDLFGGFAGGPAESPVKFLPAICPECGWDLAGQRDSLSLLCRNCETVWQPQKGQLKKTKTAHLPAAAGEALYLPFWRIQGEVTGINLTSYADFIRTANLPKVIQNSWETIPFYFWGPAFKVRPQKYLQLATGLTVAQPNREFTPSMPPSDHLASVNLPLQEALETLKLILANLIRPRQLMVDSIQSIQIIPKEYLLAYLPFETGPHDYVQPDFKLALNKNQLSLAGNL